MNQKPNIFIREATAEDAAAILEIYAPYVKNTAITFEYDVPTLEEFAERITNIKKRHPYLVAEMDGKIVGYTYAQPFKTRAAYAWSVETSIYVRSDRKRSGIGSRLYRALEDILRAQHVVNLYACIAYPQVEDEYLSKDSAVFHERQGYTLAGTFQECAYKFGKWYGLICMEKHLDDHRMPNPPFIAFDEAKKKLGY